MFQDAWLAAESWRLLGFGAGAILPRGGAGYLDPCGEVDNAAGTQTWITARMLHCFALGKLLGYPGSVALAQKAFTGLTGESLSGLLGPLESASSLHDGEHGGWYHDINADGHPDFAAGKTAYDHAFVLLAAASATIAGIPNAAAFLAEAAEVYLTRFWDDAVGLPVDSWNTDFTTLDEYRGLNATMHSVEAFLNVADAIPAQAHLWLERAQRCADFVLDLARNYRGRLPEHFHAPAFGAKWIVDLELNADQPDDQFKPFGATPGHGLEWARLLLHLEAALGRAGAGAIDSAPGDSASNTQSDLLRVAEQLFWQAVTDSWAVDGSDGFVYTTDWAGKPVVHTRMHWVVCEAIAAAAALYQRTGDARYFEYYQKWWEYAHRYLVDEKCSWHHELDAQNHPIANVWPGKPDIYHALQATLLPRLPLAPMLADAIRQGAIRPDYPNHPRIVVIGEALVDVLPGADKTSGDKLPNDERPGGSPANVALTLARLGQKPRFITSFADDEHGVLLANWLAEAGVDTVTAQPDTGRTSTATVVLDSNGVASYEFDITWDIPAYLVNAELDDAALLHVGSIATVLPPGADVLRDAMRQARSQGTLVTFDPNARPTLTPDLESTRARVEQLVALSDVVKVSDEDLAWYYPGEPPDAVARRWAASGPQIVVVTLGGNGALAVHRTKGVLGTSGAGADDEFNEIWVPGIAIKVADTVGAGDTFMGALIDALLRDIELADALSFAAQAAAITCSRTGANPPTKAEMASVGGR